MSDARLTDEERRLLEERLPWYLNASLDRSERDWVDQLMERSAEARRLLEGERALREAVFRMQPAAAEDVGLDRLLALVKADGAGSRPAAVARPAARPAAARAWTAWTEWFARPAWAGALSLLVVAQAGTMAWWAVQHPGADDAGLRSVPVTEVRTLRVTFVPSATELQIRSALVAAGARIVGGPNQLGEYWIASDMVSLDEMNAALQKSGITASIAQDLSGPRAH